jgi:gliding motility-associated-like protein
VTTDCSTASQDVEVYPGDDCVIPEVFKEVFIPNVFSPNNDGVNDVFTVFYGSDLKVTGMDGSIFDRWGNLVYRSQESPFSWDGFFNDETMMPGVYAYVIKVIYEENSIEKELLLTGDVTLVR